ncbi:MbtH family NRPS accessory protein [Micromonospora sp. KC606]|uniref:AMP-binding protein n=1 Tax=Micromonospora sp. KC606 TaxID=2530379 RepID=UPI00104F85C5|nr:AMP-binding protein [Micromonospora sp. KC606]TDC76454.1 MbtH family NRPS accessory protein [Micromonospora sp. KC606]
MFGRKEPRHFQLVATEARDFAVWPIGRRPPRGWRVVPFAGTVQACGRHVAELRSAGGARACNGRPSPAAHATLVGLLRKAAGEQPDAPALSAADLRVSYRLLWELVDDLAGRLTESGVGPGERVAVAGRNAPDLLVAALAVLVTGATCVLSAGWRPDGAIAAVADARPGLVLAPAGSSAALPWSPMVVARWQGVTGAAWQACAALEPAVVSVGADHAEASLVVLPPKPGVAGVVWRGRQLAWLAGDCGLPPLGGGDRLLPPAPPGTPVTAVVAMRALLAGAELVLPEQGPGRTAGDSIGPGPAAPVPARWRLRADRAGGSLDEVELFGFAETSMLCAAVVPGTADLEPLPDVRLYVLDAQLGPVPRGETGELYVAGAPLAAGYLDQPELTMSRFLPDPLGEGEAGLMFRTGLLARRLSGHRFALVDPAPRARRRWN